MEHRQGRPRRADVDAAVRDATVRLVAEHGYAGTTLDAIARAAGVAKTTVYRRWETKAALVLDALVEALGDPPVPAGPGRRETELRRTVGWLAARIGEPTVHRLLVGLVAEAAAEPGVRTALRQRIRQPFEDRLVEAWGVDAAAVDLAFDVVVGALLHHAALAGTLEPRVVDAVTAVGVTLLG